MVKRLYGRVSIKRTKASKLSIVISDVPPHVSLRLKHIFPRIYLTQSDNFHFPYDNLHCSEINWFLQRYPMDMDKDTRKKLESGSQAYFGEQDAIEAIMDVSWEPSSEIVGLRKGFNVRRYQAQAVEVFKYVKSLIVGDMVGLGKTYTAAAALLVPGVLPAAVVVPTNLTKQWKNVLESFTNLRVHVIKKSKPYNLPKADVYIYRYGVLHGWTDFFTTKFFKAVVYDEIQNLRTGLSAVKGIAARVLSQNCEYRLGLTATLIYNYGIEAFNIFHYFIRPDLFGSQHEFIREWCTAQGQVVRDPKALGTFLREQNVFLRRTKKDVGQDMDPVNRIVQDIEYDEKVIRSVEDRARQLALVGVTGTFVERGQALRDLDIMMRHATGVSKAKTVADTAKIFLEEGIPILLAGWHRDVYEIWQKELETFNPLFYTGSESPVQKEKNKQAFINGESNLLIISLRSSEGTDGLQHRCSTLIVGELDWSPEVHNQLIGRLDREGQTEEVMALFLHSMGGSDPLLVKMNGLKADQAHNIIDPGTGLRMNYSNEKRLNLLAERYLKKRDIEMVA